MLETKINFAQIEDRVRAARALQEASQEKQSKEVLLALGKDIVAKFDNDK